MTYISFKIIGFSDGFDCRSICGEKLAKYLSKNLCLELDVCDSGYYLKYKGHLFLIGSDVKNDEWFLRVVKDSPLTSDPKMEIINEMVKLLSKNSDVSHVVLGD